MKDNYKLAYSLIRESEGGYSNRSKKHDPGGETNYGVTKATYDAYRKRKGLPLQSVKFITEDEVYEIYSYEYAKPVRFNDLPAGIDYFVFDTAVHSGTYWAARLLQRAVGAAEDGIIGSKTLAAVGAMPAGHLILKLRDVRLRYMKSLPNWKHNANGWTNRINKVVKAAQAMIAGTVVPPADYAHCTGEGCAKAWGEQTLTASIKDSKRSQAAVVGGAGVAATAFADMVNVAQEANTLAGPVREAFAWSQYAPMIGLLVSAAAFAYIIWHRSKSRGYA